MSSSFTNGYVNINHEYKREDSLPSSFGVVPPSIAPKPAYIKGQLPRRFNKIPLKRETSLPPFSFGTTLSQSQSPQTGKDQTNVLKPVVKPNYVRSNSSLSMYEERKKSRDQHNQQLHKLGYMPALLNSSSRRGSIDNFYGGGGDIESASSTRCSTPNRLMGSLSKIPIWTGSQEKLNTLRQNPISPNSSLQKTPTSSRILPPTPNNVANVSGNRIGGTVKGKRLNSKKWESCSNLESSTGSASQEGRFKQMAKGKTNRNLELNEKSRQLTESLKQLQQNYSSTNIQADLKKRDMINGNKEDISLDWSMKQITTPSENDANAITPIIGNSRSIDSYKHQLEEKDKIIAMLRQSIEDGNNGMTLMQSQSLMSRSIDHISSTPLTHDMDGVADKTFNVSTGLSITENDDAPMLPEVLEMKKSFKERESKLISELQDAKDQAELLEFRVLELEEEQEKQKLQKHENTSEDIKKGTKDVTLDAMNDKKYSDTVSVSGDSGCNLSTSTEPADLTELYQDFRVS
jgi:hypothetical protein